jgi:hypothetical protein
MKGLEAASRFFIEKRRSHFAKVEKLGAQHCVREIRRKRGQIIEAQPLREITRQEFPGVQAARRAQLLRYRIER